MTSRNRTREVMNAYKAGDFEKLADLAAEFANAADLADELRERDLLRKAMQTERKRAERARKAESVSRDVTGQSGTSQDSESELTTRSTTKPRSKASRAAEAPLPGVSWVTRLSGVWTSLAGAVQVGQVGKQLKLYVDTRGEPAVERGMRLFIATKQARGETLNFGWFANDAVQWIDKASKLAVENGTMNDALELASRP